MTTQSIEPLHTAKRASRLGKIIAPSAFLEFMTAGKHPTTLMDTIFSLSHRDLARRCSQWRHTKQRYTCMLKIVTGLPWESFLCLVVPRSSLSSALCAPGEINYFEELLCFSAGHIEILHIDYCELNIGDISIYWVVVGLVSSSIRLTQLYIFAYM